MAGDRYNQDSRRASDKIPDFLIDSVPYINNTNHINSQITKDKINPYLPAEKARKYSSSSIKSFESFEKPNAAVASSAADRSFNSEGDASKFSFESITRGPSPINQKHHKRIISTNSEPTYHTNYNNTTPIDTSMDQSSFSGFQNQSQLQNQTTANSSSFVTANNSTNFINNDQLTTPSQLSLPKVRSRSTSPKPPLTIQTSTPNTSFNSHINNTNINTNISTTNELYNDSTNSSINQFSFFNTSPASYPDSPSSNIKNFNQQTKRSSIIPKESPHSRNSSISWAVNNPNEWTIERVVYWLELHQFNETWSNTFIKHDIIGSKFLSMTNYQNLKNLKKELSTSNDSTQSRFIHLLRKTLDKPLSSSGTTINTSSPLYSTFTNTIEPIPNNDNNSFNSSSPSFDSLKSSPANSIGELNFKNNDDNDDINSLQDNDRLVPTISAPQLFIPSNNLQDPQIPSVPPIPQQQQQQVVSQQVSQDSRFNPPMNPANNPPPLHPQQRLTRVNTKRRPVSTYEHSSKNMWSSNYSPVSPAFSNHSHHGHGFFRRHQKSSSSESSLFSSILPNSGNNTTSGTTGTTSSSKDKDNNIDLQNFNKDYDNKRSSIISKNDNNESKGLLSKFRLRNDRSKSKEPILRKGTQSPVSPISMSAVDLQQQHDQQQQQKSKLEQKKSNDTLNFKPLIIDRQFLPIPNNKNSDKYILITKDNEFFQPINIGDINDLTSLKSHLFKKIDPNCIDASIHLTEFGSTQGEALDDLTLNEIIQKNFNNCSIKLFISPIDYNNLTSTITNSTSISNTSLSDSQSFETKGEDKLYPNTPQHFYDISSNKPSGEVDYLNFKNFTTTNSSTSPNSNNGGNAGLSSSKSLNTRITPPISNINPRSPPIIINPPPLSRNLQSLSTSNLPQPKSSINQTSNPGTNDEKSSFRVIRPKERPEINFDKRRESPFARPQNSFIAKRSAPPPPLLRKQSSKYNEKSLLTPVKESVSNEGTYIASYTPGSSNTLVPEPYKGSSDSISPASRKVFEFDQELEKQKQKQEGGNELERSKTTISRANDGNNISRKSSILRNRNNTIKRSITRKFSQNARDKFQENVISFDDAPTLDDETSDDDSDDDFWAKAPTDLEKNEANNNNDHDDKPNDVEQIETPETPEISKMVVRPAPEVLYDNLEKFFPNANLDQPVVDVTPPTSPNVEVKKKFSNNGSDQFTKRVISSTSFDEDGIEKLAKPHRVKTIRAVAREAGEARKRESIRRTIHQNISNNNTNNNSNNSTLVRRQSTKMWGKKVIEVKPNQTQYLSKLRSSRGEFKQFSWIRGDLIGKGTFGNVYLALNVTTGEMIAVKQVLKPKNYSEGNNKISEVIEAMKSEVETLKDLDHLNIVQYLGFEQTEKEYNLFLEYVAGGSIASCLRLYGKFEEPLIRFLTSQVLKGLSYLHSRGILHRDMKADNLLLDLDGVCKISDFGISKKSNDIYANDAAMSMQGTIFWMAPEVVDSREGYSAKVDIWSLGCVVLEMFAGRRPWSNLEAISAMFKIGKSKSAPPIPDDVLPNVSKDGQKFLDNCFAIDANKRPTAQELTIDSFCNVDENFTFNSTRLSQLIKANEKKITL
ncbi:Serine/threonine-protein kinase [Wickerhamomyces ciferrii]|uniref:mitogen-activated protein kinase kinase kinase n=1 Tax=Wickerhamomyces ciferrii (strain ATCC 14091 / BCRC 22168 / CBS 111 / JCM 3599 / NBRC 0793 / NRRL Y-1031 F-60-10) TaxID=1206466 RepID=K0KYB8_WICCF|nr:Serine/threonine-protein kinase [Wickerhamomyces ciferrii]CCH46439.1 Serine/threonine-protein kinase [Wickerhamomyces ciferrii]